MKYCLLEFYWEANSIIFVTVLKIKTASDMKIEKNKMVSLIYELREGDSEGRIIRNS